MSKNLFLSPILAPVYEDIAFEFRDIMPGTGQEYVLDISASYSYSIESATLQVDTGTLTGVQITIESQAPAVLSLSNLTVGNTVTTTYSTGAKIVPLTKGVSLVTSTGYTGAPTLLRGKIKIVRI